MNFGLIRIAITGPESTGKSQLSMELADYYHTVWVPEYAREYLEKLDRPYTEADLLKIAKGQIADEKRMEKGARRFLFCDTELLVIKIWSEVRYGFSDPWILKKLEEQSFDLYLLCYIDTPWDYDPLREHPGMRERLFSLYHDEMIRRNLPFSVVKDLDKKRLLNAVKIINERFPSYAI